MGASEEAIAGIFREVLGVSGIGRESNFFDIGGDSLKAMDVIVRVGELMQVELPLFTFFEDPTVAHLAAVVDELKGGETAAPIARVPGRTEFPLSYGQQVFWLLEQQNPDSGLYNTTRIFRIYGRVDAVVLERAINELCRRQEILRVRFLTGVNGPVQVAGPGEPLSLALTDLAGVPAAEREEAARRVALETVREPFRLERGPAMRARLVRLSDEESLLCMAIHHVVSDGFTGSILLDELVALYDAFASGEPSPLPELELHFTDYAAWEQEWMRGERLERELAYWRGALAGVPGAVNLPTDRARSAEPDRKGHLRASAAPGDVLAGLQVLAQANGTTLFAVLTAGMRALLYRWSGQKEFLIGTVASNRSRGGTERMFGCFVNPLAIRNAVREGQSVRELLSAEKSAAMDAFAHQDCPFAKIVEAINPERTSNDNPLFNVALLLQSFPSIERTGRHFRAEHIHFDAEVALLDLRFIVTETSGGLRVVCEYKSSLFDVETVDALLEAYTGVLRAMAANPAGAVAELPLPEALAQQANAARRRDYRPAIAVSASFTAEPVAEPLAFLLQELGLSYRVEFAPYQQVFQQLLDPASQVRTADGFGVLLVRWEDWLHGEGSREKIEALAGELTGALRAALNGPASLIVCFCPASRARRDWSEWLERLETQVADAFSGGRVQVIGSRELQDLYPVEEYEDEYAQKLGNVPYTADMFSAIGTMLMRRIWSLTENHYKVIALGDSLPGGGVLEAALLEQRDAGMLLCLCSEAADEAQASLPIASDELVAASFGRKASAGGLQHLAGDLGLGLENFIYLSADAEECAAVEAAMPEVLVQEVPADAAGIPAWLAHVWAFDRPGRNLSRAAAKN